MDETEPEVLLQPIKREGSTEQELMELQEIPELSGSSGQSPCTSRSATENIANRHCTNSFSPTRGNSNHIGGLSDGEILMEKVGDFRSPQREEQRLVRTTTEESLTSQPPKLPPAGKFLLAERNIGVVFGSLSILGRSEVLEIPNIHETIAFSYSYRWCLFQQHLGRNVSVRASLVSRAGCFFHQFNNWSVEVEIGTVELVFMNIFGF